MGINRNECKLALNLFIRTAQNNNGFTLIELIMVCALIGVLATMAVTGISDFKNKTKISRAAAEIRGLEKDIIAFASEKGAYPTDLTVAGMVQLNDPWGNAYEYKPAGTRTYSGNPINTDFDLWSYGPIKGVINDSIIQGDSPDDIIRARDGSFDESAIRYPL